MTRKKVELRLIENENARRASFKKRKVGLTKKVSELNTLCAVSTFLIVFGPDDTGPTIWPPSPAIEQIIMHYQSLPNMEQSKKNLNQEGYLTQRLKKVQDQLKKARFTHKQARASYLMHEMEQGKNPDEFTDEELESLIWLMDTRVKHYMGRDFSTFGSDQNMMMMMMPVPTLQFQPPPQHPNDFEAMSSGAPVGFMQDQTSFSVTPHMHGHGHPDPPAAVATGGILGFPNDLSNTQPIQLIHPIQPTQPIQSNNPYFPSLL